MGNVGETPAPRYDNRADSGLIYEVKEHNQRGLKGYAHGVAAVRWSCGPRTYTPGMILGLYFNI